MRRSTRSIPSACLTPGTGRFRGAGSGQPAWSVVANRRHGAAIALSGAWRRARGQAGDLSIFGALAPAEAP